MTLVSEHTVTAESSVEAEALIREARRLRRRRWIIGSLVLGLVIGGGLAAVFGTGGSGPRNGRAGSAQNPAQFASTNVRLKDSAIFTPGSLPSQAGRSFGLVSPGVGWTVTGGGYTPFYVTTNGGKTWKVWSTPAAQIRPSLQSYASLGPHTFAMSIVAFIWDDPRNPSDGCGNAPAYIDVTSNAGATWKVGHLPDCVPATSMSFLNEQDGFALHGGDYGPLGKYYDGLFQTTDGGTKWSVVGPTPINNSITFTSDTNGWGLSQRQAVFHVRNKSLPAETGPSSIALWHTTNGGKTWRKVPLSVPGLPKGDSLVLGAPQFFGSRDGVVPVDVSAPGDSITGFWVESTTDGGSSWEAYQVPLKSPDLKGYLSGLYPSKNSGIELVPFSAGSATTWFVGAGSDLYVTRNGGRTWTASTSPIWSGERFTGGFQFASSEFGWATVWGNSQDEFLQTTNGGRTWTVLTTGVVG